MGKLSIVLKQDEVLCKLCQFSPAAWLKIRRTARLLLWRLPDDKLSVFQRQLVEEYRLQYADFHDLCERGDAECVWLMLAQGMSVKVRDTEGGTLLQKATHSGGITILKLLVEKGANVNAKGAYGYTPLHEACYVGHTEVCSYLLATKANVDALSKNGSTPLLVCAREGHNKLCEALLQYGAHPDDGGDKGWSPLSVAAGEGHLEVCTTLLRHSANANGFTGDGRHERSALHEAAEQGHTEVVDLLLQQKADATHSFDEDKDGAGRRVTALDLAERNGHQGVATLLRASA